MLSIEWTLGAVSTLMIVAIAYLFFLSVYLGIRFLTKQWAFRRMEQVDHKH